MSKKTDADIISEAIESYLLEAPELRLVHGGKKTDPVMFRKSKEDGEVTAVFPAKGYEATRDGHPTSYAHVGQHGAAHPDWIEQDTVPLDHSSPEVQSLHKELTGKGYKLEPISPEHHAAHIKNMKKRMAVVESVDSFLAETESPHEPFPSSDFKKVKLGTKGKHTLSHVTRLKDNHSFYHLTDDWRADYPLHHPHNDSVAFDNPEYFPKKVVSWASDLVRKHAKGTVSESTESVIEEDYKARLKKLGFSEQIPAQTQDGLSGVYRFDHPDYEIEARPKADPAKYFKYTVKDKRTGQRRVSQHLSHVEKFLANKSK